MSKIDLDEYASLGQGSYVQNADIFENQPYLSPQRANVGVSASIAPGTSGRVGAVRGYASYNGMAYAVDWRDTNGAGLYGNGIWSSSDASTWTDKVVSTTDDPDIEPPGGMWIQSATAYFFTTDSAEIASHVYISSYDLNVTITDHWDDLFVSAWGSDTTTNIGGFLQHNDGNTYLWKDRYLGVYDGTTKPSLVTPISVPAGYKIKDATAYGNKVLFVANPLSNFYGTAKLYVRDPVQNTIYTYDDVYDIGIYNVQAIRQVGSRIFLINAFNNINIYEWLGGDRVEKVAVVPVNYYDASVFGVRWPSVLTLANKLFFGTFSTSTTLSSNSSPLSGGVYCFGHENADDPWALQNFITTPSAAYDVSDMDYKALGVLSTQNGGIAYLMQTAKDNDASAYRNSNLQFYNTSYEANCTWESTWIRPFPGRKSMPVRAIIKGGGGTLTLSQKVDGGSYVTIATVTSFTNEEAVLKLNNLTVAPALTANFAKGHKHKFKITLGATSSDKVEKVILKFHTEEQALGA